MSIGIGRLVFGVHMNEWEEKEASMSDTFNTLQAYQLQTKHFASYTVTGHTEIFQHPIVKL